MTIVTKPRTEKKLDKPLGKPLVTAEVTGPHCDLVECPCALENGACEVEAWVSSTARRRVSTATTICVCLTALLVMSVGIIGGVYLYRQFSRHQMARFRGFCNFPYDRNNFAPLGSPKMLLGGNPSINKPHKLKDSNLWSHSQPLLKEEFDLDLADEEYEEITVPDFSFSRKGRFIHDFSTNMTGIIDLNSRRCYVMPLNRTHIYPPRTLFDLIKKMWMGHYTVDTRVVRESTRVVFPPIEDLRPLGVFITHSCSSYPTFRLRTVHVHELRKRSVNGEDDDGIQFVEFAGKNIIHLTIYGDGSEQ